MLAPPMAALAIWIESAAESGASQRYTNATRPSLLRSIEPPSPWQP
jgi:hypothetical protein